MKQKKRTYFDENGQRGVLNTYLQFLGDITVGHGIVGGRLMTAEDQGGFAAEMVVFILSGRDFP